MSTRHIVFNVDSSGFAVGRPALHSSSVSVVTTWYLLYRLAGCCFGWSGLEERSLRMIHLAGVFPLRRAMSSCAAGGSAGAGVCQSKISSADRFNCSVFLAPSEGSAGGVGRAAAGAGCSVVCGEEKKAAADGN
ncbi:hypothetical protein V6N11_082040 [Hibiscus sabdariffa]|uniref:Uncharacterized protein n=1 Tax=Hibiscus sabdariffa TaxID=183260 RepID=A0ABR2QHC3_9ROSI